MTNPRRHLLAPLALSLSLLAVGGCGDDEAGADTGNDDTPTTSTGSSAPDGTGADTGDAPTSLPACAESFNAAPLDEVRSPWGSNHRQDSAEVGQPDVLVGTYAGETFTTEDLIGGGEVTVEPGACAVIDVEGATPDSPAQYAGSVAVEVDTQWYVLVDDATQPLRQDPLPVEDAQVLVLGGSYLEPVLELPDPAVAPED